MKPRVFAALLLAGNMVFTSIAKAQMWGTGMWGGMQGCGYDYGGASGAVDGDDEIAELQQIRVDMRKEKRDAERDLRDLEAKKDRYTTSITDVVSSPWSDHAISHMENGYNCNCAPPPVYYPQEPNYPEEPPVIPIEPPVDPGPPVEPPVEPPVDEPVPRPQRPAADIFDIKSKGNRAPASADRRPAADLPQPQPNPPQNQVPYEPPVTGQNPPAGSGVPMNPYDIGWNDGGQVGPVGGFGAMCDPEDQVTQSRPWQFICRDGGGMSKDVCRHPKFKNPDAKSGDVNRCEKAISEYRKITRDIDKLRNRISQLDDQISEIGIQIGDLKRDRRNNADLEAACPTGECYRQQPRRAENKSSSVWSTILPLAAGLIGGGVAEYMGYRANKANNENLNQLGWPTQPYAAGSYGLPFVQAGIYGAIAGGTNGGFGCSPGINGGGVMTPYGMMYPNMYGMNPFGYPNGMIPGFQQMGGGMYNPGMGPWGMGGPWGNGYSPYLSMGLAGGMAGGMYGGMAGMAGMAGGYPGGMAGMAGMAGGMYGGMAGGLAIGGGFVQGGLAMGGGMAGMAGMAGGMYGGMAGMAGMAGGYPGGMAGMAGGMGLVGGFAGGLAVAGLSGGGLYGGMATGLTSPWGVAGGYAAGGFLTPVPGMAGGMAGMAGMAGGMAGGGLQQQQQLIQMQLQQYQMQLDMQRQAADNAASRLRVQQGLMSEYYSLMYKIQQVNSGGGYGLGLDLGSYNLNLGGTTTGVSSGPTGGVPGRTR